MDAGSTARARPSTAFIVLLVAAGVVTGAGILFGERALAAARDTIASGDPSVTAEAPMTAVGVAAVCYLAAAATGIRWMSWLWVPLGTLLAFAAVVLGFERWAVLALAGVVLLVVGLIRRPRVTLVQGLAMLGYFGVAAGALLLAPRIGLAVAGAALVVHAAWDVVHYRRDIVVNRSLALWCMGLDATLGGACIVLAIVG